MPMDNKSIVRRLYEEVWNQRKLAVADELLSASHALQDPNLPGSQVGPELYKQRVAELIRGFPDLRFTIEDTIAEREKFVACWTFCGTHQGEFMGVPATGKKVSVEGVTIHHFKNGKILDSYTRWDALGLLQQVGAIPARTIRSAASRAKT